MEITIESFRLLTDEQLLAEVPILVARERTATTVLIASLTEVDTRKLFRALGYSSLFRYCTRELGLSEGSAYGRIRATRVARRFPEVLNYLADGSLTLTSVNVLAPHLTVANHAALLQAAHYKTRREVEQQMAALHPEAPDLVTLHVRIARQTRDKLRRAQDLLRHVFPDGDVDGVLDRALTLLVETLERKKLATVRRPRLAQKAALGSRYIPAAVRRAVSRRDNGRCAFVGTRGRCDETGFLEFHHVVPFAAGGAATVENIQLRCRSHNQYEADVEFGGEPPMVREQAPAYGVLAAASTTQNCAWPDARNSQRAFSAEAFTTIGSRYGQTVSAMRRAPAALG